jgi:hypothetical protein
LRAFLDRASRRLAWLSAAEGATGGLALAAIIGLATRPAIGFATGVALGTVGAAAGLLRSRTERANVAQAVERRAPQCRNLVVTANELPATRVADHIAALIYQHATRVVQNLDLAMLFPARNRIAALGVAATLWALAVVRTATAPSATATESKAGATLAISEVSVTVVPPKYTGRPPQTLRDPSRIEAIVGSELRFTLRASAARVALATLRSSDTLASASAGTFTDTLAADADGYVAIEPLAADARAGVRRLIGLSVVSDEAPRVRITTPGKDSYFKDGRNTIDLAIESNDDIGLASLKLRFTKVSGSGERFTFSEGEVPLSIARRDALTWHARAQWKLDTLALGPGDMVVYRAVATDHRPGAPPSESDSYIAEVMAPGGIAAAGFALDPEQERYAVSQQMVILKTERLSKQKASMSAEAYELAAHELAAEQRKVRSEFIFMMGGELEDAPDPDADPTMLNEEAEAEGESDLAAGRNLTLGRVALQRATRLMSHAAASLTDVDLTTALKHERAALVQLERAFARTRILLRALTQRERLDFTRRLTGELTEAGRSSRPIAEAETEARAIALRHALAGVASLAGARTFAPDAALQTSLIAENVLRVDPSSKVLQEAATLLQSATTAISRDRASEARELLDRAATQIAAAAREGLVVAPSPTRATELDRLNGALGDALRRRSP